MYLDSSDIELMHDTWITPEWSEAEQVVGITFPGVDVPPWAQITSARVLFVVDEVRERVTTSFSIVIHGEAAANAALPSESSYDLSSRPLTAANATWQPAASAVVGEDLRTADVSAIVNEIIRTPGWANGNRLCLLFRYVQGS
eukprot:4696307-Prymnesium_polylepis.1